MCVRNKFKKSLPIIATMLITSSLASCSAITDSWNANVRGAPPQWQDELEFGQPRTPSLNPGGNGLIYGKRYSDKNAERADPYEVIPTSNTTRSNNSSSYNNSNSGSYKNSQMDNLSRLPSMAFRSQNTQSTKIDYSASARPIGQISSATSSYSQPASIAPMESSMPSYSPPMTNMPARSSISSARPPLAFGNQNNNLDFNPSPLEPTGELGTPPWMQENSGAFKSSYADQSNQIKKKISNTKSEIEDLSNYGGTFDPYASGDFPNGKFNPPSYQEVEKMGGDPFSPIRTSEQYSYQPMKLQYRTKYSTNSSAASSKSERRMPVMNQMIFEQKG